MSSLASVEHQFAPGKALPRALPAWTYSHPDMTRLEYERILKPSWQIVCHVSQIPNPGDFSVFDIGPDSVIVLRDKDGTVRAFHNVCRHRAARLLEGEGNCPRAINCPYHGWSYAHDGKLLGVSLRDTLPGLDRSEFGLSPVRSDTLFGFVFICLAGDPMPLAEIWAPFLDVLAPYRIEEMQPLGSVYFEEWDVDWKVAMDNYLESYHVPIGHPGLFRMFTPDYEEQSSSPGGVACGVSRMRPALSAKWSERAYQKLVREVETDLPEADKTTWRFYSMVPNLGIDVFPDQMDFFQVLPRGPGKCTIRGATFALPDSRREMTLLRYLNARINRQVQREDEFLCKRVQRGLSSSGYVPGPLSTHEMWVLQFHELIRTRIPAAREASAPDVFI
jgi:phenylpropionate dioxygenase-like ring-hydroxylating dioxygenase large terminal subunit